MDEKVEGVKAIIYLQSLAGIVEPEERAARNWDGFADWEREQTLRAYRVLKPEAEVGEAQSQRIRASLRAEEKAAWDRAEAEG